MRAEGLLLPTPQVVRDVTPLALDNSGSADDGTPATKAGATPTSDPNPAAIGDASLLNGGDDPAPVVAVSVPRPVQWAIGTRKAPVSGTDTPIIDRPPPILANDPPAALVPYVETTTSLLHQAVRGTLPRPKPVTPLHPPAVVPDWSSPTPLPPLIPTTRRAVGSPLDVNGSAAVIDQTILPAAVVPNLNPANRPATDAPDSTNIATPGGLNVGHLVWAVTLLIGVALLWFVLKRGKK